jgi:hypothetical protein
VPTWIVNGGIPPPDNEQPWVDVQPVTVLDAWAGQRNERGSPDKPGSAVDKVVEPSKLLPEGIGLN